MATSGEGGTSSRHGRNGMVTGDRKASRLCSRVAWGPSGRTGTRVESMGGRRSLGRRRHLVSGPLLIERACRTVSSASRGHDWAEPFRCDVQPDRETVRVLPVGEIDLDTVGEVAERLRELQEAGFAEVVLDLRGVTFMDSAGLHLVLATDAIARRDGTTFVVIAGPPVVQRLFEVVGVHESLQFRSA